MMHSIELPINQSMKNRIEWMQTRSSQEGQDWSGTRVNAYWCFAELK